jgi:hypothetical protein
MNELVKALQSRIAELERENARYESARRILVLEIEHWREKALGIPNTHPDACAWPAERFRFYTS